MLFSRILKIKSGKKPAGPLICLKIMALQNLASWSTTVSAKFDINMLFMGSGGCRLLNYDVRCISFLGRQGLFNFPPNVTGNWFVALGMNGDAVARNGPILWENDATGSRNVSRYLLGLWDTINKLKMTAKVTKSKHSAFYHIIYIYIYIYKLFGV